MAAATLKTSNGGQESAIPPNQSLYVQNLPDRLKKDDLKRELYMLFSTYGVVLDITALKTSKMRGQAHVLFRDINSATQAMRHCQQFDFFGKEMKISYAKSRSHTLAKLTGTFHEPQQESQQPESAEQQPRGKASEPAPTPAVRAGAPGKLAPPPGFPPKSAHSQPASAKAGTKHEREESDDEDGAEPMEQESDEGGEMEMSEDEED